MARIRTIKPGFFKHGDLYDAEVESGFPLRIAYAGLWTIADREGRFKWKPRDIKPDVLPYDNVNMDEVMVALEAKGFVQRYSANGQEYGWIPAFLAHQHINIREQASDIPEPPKNKNARAKRVQKPALDRVEGKGKEGKESSFDLFWKAYPKKEAKADALKAFDRALEKTNAPTLIVAASAYAAKRAGDDKQFTKLPATWLNKGCWEDDGVAPAPEPDAEAATLASAAWDGRAAPLVQKIGPAQFGAWFGEAKFEPGPPTRIVFAKPFARQWVNSHFRAELERIYGETHLDVAA